VLALAVLALPLALAGCAGDPRATATEVGPDTTAARHDDGTVVLVPTRDPRGGADALTSGALVRLDGGCLGLRADDGTADGVSILVRWPYGTTWDPEQQELLVSRLQPGGDQRPVRLGDPVSLGGGTWGSAPTSLGCRADVGWSAS
jgi:hypothetical protein